MKKQPIFWARVTDEESWGDWAPDHSEGLDLLTERSTTTAGHRLGRSRGLRDDPCPTEPSPVTDPAPTTLGPIARVVKLDDDGAIALPLADPANTSVAMVQPPFEPAAVAAESATPESP